MPYLPPSLGRVVTYRQWSWLGLVEKEWGSSFRQPDHGIYTFSDGRRFDSTDMYRTGIYGAIPSVTQPILSGQAFANGNQLNWTAATISGSTIQAYIVFSSATGPFEQIAVVQGTVLEYFDAVQDQGPANVVDDNDNQLIDPALGDDIVVLIPMSEGGVSYYVVAESALGSMSAQSNTITVVA